MQAAYMGALMELAEKDGNILHVLADSGTGYDEMFRRNFPNRILNCGISEENAIGVAAGLATTGKIPYVFTAGAFLAYRALEFIRDDICFQNLNVKIVGMGSGLSWSSLGPTHHTTEDFSVLRAIPNLMILSPATPIQVSRCVKLAYLHTGPVYLRIEMNKEKELFDEKYSMGNDGFEVMRDGTEIAVYATGSIVGCVMDATEKLNMEGHSIKVASVHCIKPFNANMVLDDSMIFNKLVTVEEHNIYGGLGGIVSETVAYHGLGIKVIPIGINDRFAQGYGTHGAVKKVNSLDTESIYKKIKDAINE